MRFSRSVFFLSIIFLSIGLASCGGNSNTGSSLATTPADSTSASTSKKTSSLGEFATSIGCSEYAQEKEAAPFTSEWGRCTFDGISVQAYQFPNKEAMDSFFDTVKSFGIVIEQTAVKDLFVFAPEDATKLGSLKTAVQG